MNHTYLVKVLLDSIPVPAVAAILFPVIKGSLATTDPCIVIETAAATQNLSSRVRLLNPGVVRAINHRRLIFPIVGSIAAFECARGSGDLVNLLGIAR